MIHPTAIIDKAAIVAEGVEIGPYSVIEKDVCLGKNIRIGPFVHIKGKTSIGDNTSIGSGSVIGESPQIIGHTSDQGRLYIGKANVIREGVSIHTSSSSEKETFIGDHNFLMGFSHIAHDCRIENRVIIANSALIAGHVEIQDNVFISGNVVVHQFVRIGQLAMVGGLSRVTRDITPFMMVVGNSRVWGINSVGLKRAGLSLKSLRDIKKAFFILYRKGNSFSTRIELLKQIDSEVVRQICDFIQKSKRGICGPKKSTFLEKLFLDYPYFVRNAIPVKRIISQVAGRKDKKWQAS